MNLFHNVFVIALKVRVFLYQNVNGILQSIQNYPFRVGSENAMNDLIQKDEIKYSNFGKKYFNLYFYSDNLSHYKTYDFRKFFIRDALKHVRLQNTFNRCKIHQILTLTVDYACFMVKCINYQNVMCSRIVYFLQDLARFMQKLHFLQEKQLLQNFCKKWKSVARLLEEFCKMYFSQEFCKSCIDCKNFARFLQKLFFLWTREHRIHKIEASCLF